MMDVHTCMVLSTSIQKSSHIKVMDYYFERATFVTYSKARYSGKRFVYIKDSDTKGNIVP